MSKLLRFVGCGVCVVTGALAACAGLTSASSPDANRSPTPAPATRSAEAGAPRVIAFLEDRVRRDPDDVTAQNRLSGEYLRRYRKTGDDRDLFLAAKAADHSLRSVPGPQNTGGLAAKARSAFALHGFGVARDIGLQLVESEPDKRFTYEILSDSLLELGQYDKAAEALAKLELLGEPDVASESRHAKLALVRGQVADAKDRLARATRLAGAMTPASPELLAWCHVQSGQLAFSTGDWETAEKQYQSAASVSPDDWATADHIAELRAAQKRYDESVELYQALVRRVPRPELMQALGDVYVAMGKPEEAKPWHAKALAAYLTSTEAGGSHYYHHLAGFYCDSQPNADEAVKWAKKDLELRQSVYAQDGLAWALYQAGEHKSAAEAMDKALAQGTRDAHLLFHASLIYAAAGPTAKARECLKKAGEVNPRFTEFHVHR